MSVTGMEISLEQMQREHCSVSFIYTEIQLILFCFIFRLLTIETRSCLFIGLFLLGRSSMGFSFTTVHMDRVKRIWYLSPMRAAKVQASLRIRAVSPEPPLLAHTSNESRGTFRQKARSLAPLNGWACAVKICHDGMLEDTNSLDGAHMNVCYTNEI